MFAMSWPVGTSLGDALEDERNRRSLTKQDFANFLQWNARYNDVVAHKQGPPSDPALLGRIKRALRADDATFERLVGVQHLRRWRAT